MTHSLSVKIVIFEGSIKNRMDAMEIAEELAPLFQSKIKDSDGNEARFISVSNIEYTQTVLQDKVDYEINMHLLSDQGELHQSIIIREFANPSEVRVEMDGYYDALDVCVDYNDINVFSLIKCDPERGVIIWTKPAGIEIDRLGVSAEIKNFILGRIYGVLHGSRLEKLDDGTLQEFLTFLINHLPFTDEEKRSVQNLIERELIKYKQNFGGLESKILIRPSEIIFTIRDSKVTLDETKVKEGSYITSHLKFETPDKLILERMSDIGYLFNDQALNEFQTSGNLNQTVKDVKQFFRGYSSSLQSLHLPSIGEIYPIENTINLQLLFVAWLREVEKIQIGAIETHSQRDILQYTYYLLTENPFFDIFNSS